MAASSSSSSKTFSTSSSPPPPPNYWTTADLYDVGISNLSKHIQTYQQKPVVISTSSDTPTTHLTPRTPEYLAWRRLHVSKAKLDGVGEIATFLAGFAVVATVELQINEDANPTLLVAFTITTALLVCSTITSVMISTCILPHITVVAKVGHPEAEPSESPHDQMSFFIDLSWVLANTISIFLFTLDVILLIWIKYTYFSVTASYCATAIMGTVLVGILVFGVAFYRKIIKHQAEMMGVRFEELEEISRRMMERGAAVGRVQHV